jgi:hypothetical protein
MSALVMQVKRGTAYYKTVLIFLVNNSQKIVNYARNNS